MKSPVIKRSIIIDGHKTSITLEDAFWSGLKEIAYRHRSTLSKLVTQIDKTRQQGNLSSAIRLFVLEDHPYPSLTLNRRTEGGCLARIGWHGWMKADGGAI